GNLNTRFSSNFADDAWLTVDLGKETAFNRVVINWENAYGKQFLIQASHDNVDWSNTVYTQANGKGGIDDLSFNTTTARYIRLQGQQRATGYGYSLFEFAVYNDPSKAAGTGSGSTGTGSGSTGSGSGSTGSGSTGTGGDTGTQQPASPFVEQPANQAVPAGQPGHFAVMMSG
ncbi:discoidin domain-containing protein, partial [Paraburkholderia sp. BCC1885]